MLGIRLYLIQRISALVMVPLVLLHLIVMIYATQGGLSAAEILARTQGSLFWGFVYGLFVLAASLHAAIGLRVIIYEWLKPPRSLLDPITLFICFTLMIFGWRAIYAVIIS